MFIFISLVIGKAEQLSRFVYLCFFFVALQVTLNLHKEEITVNRTVNLKALFNIFHLVLKTGFKVFIFKFCL